jgi:hypothetical protein
LREELERANFQYRSDLEEARRSARDEHTQLQEMISVLRTQLEKANGR